MLPSLLLTFREGLEAALIVGIILGYLRQVGQMHRQRWIWAAVGCAAALSLGLALGLQAVGAELEGRAEYIFEGLAMLLAVVVLTWMIFWMRRHAHAMRASLQNSVQTAVQRGAGGALFGVAFLAVLREGVETALFLTAARIAGDGLSTLIGGVSGLVLAVALGWAIYSGSARLDVRRFFDVSSALLLVFAAGLFAHGVHELQEAGWLPVFVEHIWSTKATLNDGSTLGAMLRTLVGYNDDPSLLEVLGYGAYWAAVLSALRWWRTRVLGRALAVGV